MQYEVSYTDPSRPERQRKRFNGDNLLPSDVERRLASKGMLDIAVVNLDDVPKQHQSAPDTKECPWCAERIAFKAKKCKHCGEMLEPRDDTERVLNQTPSDHAKNKMSAFMLLLFFGYLGAHAFYAGRQAQGCVYLFGWFIVVTIGVAISATMESGIPFFFAIGTFGIFVGVLLVSDSLQILSGTYVDGEGRKISEWV